MKRTVLAAAVALVLGACGLEDTTPSDVFFTMTGPAGTEVQLVLSTQFVAGVTEDGVTQVRMLHSDTLVRALPVDTVVSVAIDHRFFVEAVPVEGESVEVRVVVDVDDRHLYDKQGLVLSDPPFRYVYLFNQPYTESVDVVF